MKGKTQQITYKCNKAFWKQPYCLDEWKEELRSQPLTATEKAWLEQQAWECALGLDHQHTDDLCEQLTCSAHFCPRTKPQHWCRGQQPNKPTYWISSWFVWCHVAVELRSVRKRVTAQGAAEVILVLFMAVFNVLLQGGETLVPSVAVRAGEQLGKCIRCSCTGQTMHQTYYQQQTAFTFTPITVRKHAAAESSIHFRGWLVII